MSSLEHEKMVRKSISEGFDDVRVIDKYQYDDFEYLPYIHIGAQVIGFGIQTFRYCKQLRSIDVDENNPFFTSVDGVLFDKNVEVLICYPANRIGKSYSLPKTVRRVEDFAFSGANKLLDIELNQGLVEIGDCAFEGCSSISEINLPKSLETIGNVAFQGCEKIKTIHIPYKTVCTKFPALPENLESITVSSDNPEYVVIDNVLYSKDMKRLITALNKDIPVFEVPESVYRIESSAFSRCKLISKIIIGENVQEIGDNAFSWLEHSQIVSLPASLYENTKERFGSPFSLSEATVEVY